MCCNSLYLICCGNEIKNDYIPANKNGRTDFTVTCALADNMSAQCDGKIIMTHAIIALQYIFAFMMCIWYLINKELRHIVQ